MKITERKLRVIIRSILKENEIEPSESLYLYNELDIDDEGDTGADSWIADLMGQEMSDVVSLGYEGGIDDDQNPDVSFYDEDDEAVCKEFSKQYKKLGVDQFEQRKNLPKGVFTMTDVHVGKAPNGQIIVITYSAGYKTLFIPRNMV